jgi:hypothetical protein
MKTIAVARQAWLTLAILACGDGAGPVVRPRSFLMGFTDFPSGRTQAAVDDAYRILRDDADLVVYHFDDGVPWQEAATGAPYDPAVQARIAYQVAHRPAGHALLLDVTPIDFFRSGLALHLGASAREPLTPPWDTVGFGDSLVIRAFTAHCERMIQAYQPDYFAYGIEVNMLAEFAPAKWPGFVVLAESVSTTLKRNHPALPVFTTIQLELAYTHQATNGPAVLQALQWSDILAVSTYPYSLPAAPGDLPSNYFTGLAALAGGKPFAISETGWPAEPITAPYPIVIPASPADQDAYVRRLLGDLDTMHGVFINWFISRDYDSLWVSDLQNSPDSALTRIWRDDGLYTGDGSPRPALQTWRGYLARPGP